MIGDTTTTNPPVDDSGDPASPTDVFELLADETRFEILRALWGMDQEPLSYTAIRRRANVDDSSRFNYHLKRLTGTLVTDLEDGYRVRPGAEPLLDAVFGARDDEESFQFTVSCQ